MYEHRALLNVHLPNYALYCKHYLKAFDVLRLCFNTVNDTRFPFLNAAEGIHVIQCNYLKRYYDKVYKLQLYYTRL